MATFNIQKDSVKTIGGKTSMTVTFKAGDREVTQYHEVESAEEGKIMEELQKTANEFESREEVIAETPKLQTGKDLTHELCPEPQV